MYSVISIDGGLNAVNGIFANGIYGNLKGKGELETAFMVVDGILFPKQDSNLKLDIGYIYSKFPFIPYAVFTKNKFKAAPIKHFLNEFCNTDKKSNFFLINTTNANAITGEDGIKDIKEIFDHLLKREEIINPISSSTGVIGVRLPKEKIKNSLKQITLENKERNKAAQNFDKSILTTDRFTKSFAFKIYIDDYDFTLAASAKGAGMISPSLATMLCFIATDFCLESFTYQEINSMLNSCVENSFNKISVDGDMSTNDSVFLFSTNEKKIVNDKYKKLKIFKEVLDMLLLKLAILMVKDGEGSNKVVCFEIKNAKSKEDAKKIAHSLINSILVKTAIFGNDPNWGRIASTIGSSGAWCDELSLCIKIGDTIVYDKGHSYLEEMESEAKKIMSNDEYKITCDIGYKEAVDSNYEAYGCDLGYEYIKINSDYRS